ncbi:MAG: IclR family transcriptional regulator [Candidatus Limnocylindria bacterium]
MESLSTVEKAVELLYHLHESPAPQGVTAIGRALGVPKSSAHRLLTALSRRGLVEQDGRGRYGPGIGLVALGLGALEREPVVAAARPVLEQEAEALGETFFLVGSRAGRLVVLDKAEGSGFLRAAPRVGSTVPVHATAAGKLYLAFAPDLLAPPPEALEPFTPRTAGGAAALEREVAQARRRGWAVNREEWIPGLSVIAAPIRIFGGGISAGARLVAVVAVAAPVQRMRTLGEPEVSKRTLAAAARIAARLEGRTP